MQCKRYSLKDRCEGCGSETKDAHYKYIKLCAANWTRSKAVVS